MEARRRRRQLAMHCVAAVDIDVDGASVVTGAERPSWAAAGGLSGRHVMGLKGNGRLGRARADAGSCRTANVQHAQRRRPSAVFVWEKQRMHGAGRERRTPGVCRFPSDDLAAGARPSGTTRALPNHGGAARRPIDLQQPPLLGGALRSSADAALSSAASGCPSRCGRARVRMEQDSWPVGGPLLERRRSGRHPRGFRASSPV